MRLKFYTLSILLFTAVTCINAGLYTNKKGKYGYIDESRAINIPCKYDMMTEFNSHGLAIVQKKAKWGCIDYTGKAVVPIKYRYISQFENGYAKVSSDNGLGLIDEKGHFVLNAEWGFIREFNNSGIAIIGTKDGEMGVVNTKGNVVCGFGKQISYYDEDSKRINISADMDTVPGRPEYFFVHDTETFYYLTDEGKNKYVSRVSLRNLVMQAIFSCKGNDAMPDISGWGDFQDGVVTLTATVNITNTTQVGIAVAYYIIKEDKVFKWMKFYKEKSEIEKGNTFKGTEIFIPYKFNHGYGCCTHVDAYGKTTSYVFGRDGENARIYKRAFGFNKQGYMIVLDSITNKFGVVNSDFQYVVNPEYGDVKLYDGEPLLPPYGRFLAVKDGYWGELDLDGNVIIPFTMKDMFYSTVEGLVGYSKDGNRWGLMNENGLTVTGCKFKEIYKSYSPASVCGQLKGLIHNKIYVYDLVNGDSTSNGYDLFVKTIKANSDHGGQIFILGTTSYRDTTYTLIDGNLNMIVDNLQLEEDALQIAYEECQKPFKRKSAIDMKRFRLEKSVAKRKYAISELVSESDWDY